MVRVIMLIALKVLIRNLRIRYLCRKGIHIGKKHRANQTLTINVNYSGKNQATSCHFGATYCDVCMLRIKEDTIPQKFFEYDATYTKHA